MLTSNPTPQKVSILFTSDEHGYITRQSKLQSEVTKARQANPEGTLLISCGDVFEGSSENGVLGLSASHDMLKTAGYDVATMGNHDFDRGAEVTRDWIKNIPVDMLVSNLKDATTGKLLPNTAPSKVYDLNGVKVGLIGVTTQETVSILPKEKLEGLSIEDPTSAVKVEVEKLKSQGIEVIGLVSHLGLPTDRKIADLVPELDFILGGHTHDFLEKPEQHGQTLIVHPGCFRQAIGHLDLDVDPITGQIERVDYKLVKGQDLPDDTGEVGNLATTLKAQVDHEMGKTVANIPNPLNFDPNILGDGMENTMSLAVEEQTGADLMMINQKGMRAPLKQGAVTLGDIYNVFPFDTKLVTIEMSADQAMSYFKDSFNRLDQTSLGLSAMPMCYANDVQSHEPMLVVNAPTGHLPARVQPAVKSSKETNCATEIGVVDGSVQVKVATLDFLLDGGLNYFEPGSQSISEDHGTVRDSLRAYLTKHHPNETSA